MSARSRFTPGLEAFFQTFHRVMSDLKSLKERSKSTESFAKALPDAIAKSQLQIREAFNKHIIQAQDPGIITSADKLVAALHALNAQALEGGIEVAQKDKEQMLLAKVVADRFAQVIKDLDSGNPFQAGDPKDSLLIKAIHAIEANFMALARPQFEMETKRSLEYLRGEVLAIQAALEHGHIEKAETISRLLIQAISEMPQHLLSVTTYAHQELGEIEQLAKETLKPLMQNEAFQADPRSTLIINALSTIVEGDGYAKITPSPLNEQAASEAKQATRNRVQEKKELRDRDPEAHAEFVQPDSRSRPPEVVGRKATLASRCGGISIGTHRTLMAQSMQSLGKEHDQPSQNNP